MKGGDGLSEQDYDAREFDGVHFRIPAVGEQGFENPEKKATKWRGTKPLYLSQGSARGAKRQDRL